jgi:AmmeMemoRadiSam system protein A
MYTGIQQKYLLKLARQAIEHFLNTGKELIVDENEIEKPLIEDRGVFVTLNINNNLRGCIGHIIPVQALYKDVIENAVSAAFHDPRFQPLNDDELGDIKIEISILSIPKKLEYSSPDDLLKKLNPGKDGIILKKGYNQATYLPQVWEGLPEKEQFLSSLCMKAGLGPDEWKSKELEIETYTVEQFEEE